MVLTCAQSSRMSRALLVLFGLAYRWATSPPALHGPRDRRAYATAERARFYSFSSIWACSNFIRQLHSRLAFPLISKLYHQMCGHQCAATALCSIS